MNESEFNDIVDNIFIEIEDAIEEVCDEKGADIDYETTSGILTLSFTNGTQIIINRQAPLKQIWVAARQGGFHFDFNSEAKQWLCNDKELFSALSEYCSEQAGQSIKLETS
ncbi:MAG: iron donor protein CyaY [Gammaproteobacteria bacterium]|nr:iron donor protein CyaY [Gammaproteobacteria bacterium]